MVIHARREAAFGIQLCRQQIATIVYVSVSFHLFVVNWLSTPILSAPSPDKLNLSSCGFYVQV